MIAAIREYDPFWDYDKMLDLTKDMFLKMQVAWSDRNMEPLRNMVTNDLYEGCTQRLEAMKAKLEKNFIEQIEIKKVKIIGEEAHEDKEKDTFIAYIGGHLVDYMVAEQTNKIFQNEKKEKSDFSDLYFFVRRNNTWLLDNIDNNVDIVKVLRAKQVKEQ